MNLPTCMACSSSTDHACDGTELAPDRWLCSDCRRAMSPYELAKLRMMAERLDLQERELDAIEGARKDMLDALPPREPWERSLYDEEEDDT